MDRVDVPGPSGPTSGECHFLGLGGSERICGTLFGCSWFVGLHGSGCLRRRNRGKMSTWSQSNSVNGPQCVERYPPFRRLSQQTRRWWCPGEDGTDHKVLKVPDSFPVEEVFRVRLKLGVIVTYKVKTGVVTTGVSSTGHLKRPHYLYQR